MRKLLLKILLRFYRKALRDFVKISAEDEFNCYKFGTPNDVVKLLKYLQTTQILWYYDSKSEEERMAVKGASMILKILVDGHNEVMEIIEHESNEERQLFHWDKYKKKNRTN